MWAISVKKLSRVTNRPTDEKSPNGRKIGYSGHPVRETVLFHCKAKSYHFLPRHLKSLQSFAKCFKSNHSLRMPSELSQFLMRTFTTGNLLKAKSQIGVSEVTHLRGCQMVYFKTKNGNLGIFWRAL
jgi:hypothetical protein